MSIKLYDGLNYYRIVLENDHTGSAPRAMLARMAHEPEHVHIWVWDGLGNNKRRREIYPEYKMNRKPSAEDIFAAIDLFKQVLEHSSALQVVVPGYEGDDVIATLAKRYAAQNHQVIIYSNDFDMMQLSVDPNIICGAKPKEGVPPEHVRLFKTLVGDPADNIKGVPGFGKKAWEDCNKSLGLKLMERGSFTEEQLIHLGVNPSPRRWMLENQDIVLNTWKITGFFDVDISEINKYTKAGVPNSLRVNELLQGYFL